MTDTIGTALLRRNIGRRLATLRRGSGLTQEQAAIRLERGRATLMRIEDGDERVRFRDIDVRAMLELYGAGEQDRQILLALAAETRNGRRKGWRHDYTETALPPWFSLFVTLEEGAESIRSYEPELVPGLLQTPAYAERVILLPSGYLSEDVIQSRIKVRAERQQILTRPRAPHLTFVLNEAVLHRVAADPELTVEQLQHLLDIGEQPNVTIRILAWTAGIHAGMAAAAGFSLFQFPRDTLTDDPLEPALVYVDGLTGAMYLNKPDEVHAYELAWTDLDQRALTPAESRNRITAMIKERP